MQVGVAAQEAGFKLLGNAQHVVHHQYLPVHVRAGAYTYDRDLQALGYFFGQCRWYLFEHDGEAT